MKIKQKLSAGIFLLVLSFLAFACKKTPTNDSDSTKKDSVQTTTDSLNSKKVIV
ncbi:hypothetical protein ACQ9BO_25000 [Flavobacterium sp. P21]|uniref:hypothetical protein n=1 Tax=Flavobacterium sp. P21 TaxID=3423948 RepID=UPI003D66EC2F